MRRHKLLNKYLEDKPLLSDEDLEKVFKALFSLDEEDNYAFNTKFDLEQGTSLFL